MSAGQDKSRCGPKRPPWRLLLRGLLLAAAVLAAAYATLPWWLPRDMLRRQVCQALSAQLGVAVSAERLDASWSGGVELHNLRIANPGGFEPGPMVSIERVATELAPIKMLLGMPSGWMTLQRPRLDVQVDQHGNVNAAALAKGQAAPPLRISVSDAQVGLRLPQPVRVCTADGSAQADGVRFDVSSAELVMGRLDRLERVTVRASMRQAGDAAPIELGLSSTSAGPTAVSMHFGFSGIRLEQLRLVELLNLPLARLAGACGGSMDLHVSSQYVVDHFALDLSVDGMDAQPLYGPHVPPIAKARLVVRGKADPVLGELLLEDVQADLPGVELAGKAVLLLDTSSLRLEGVKSAQLSGRLWPQRLAALATGGDLPGEMAFSDALSVSLTMRQEGPRLRIEAAADGTDLVISRQGRPIKPPGRLLRGQLSASLQGPQLDFAAERAVLALGGNTFSGSGQLRDIIGLTGKWAGAGDIPLGQLLEDVSKFTWSGSWRVAEVQSLRDLLAPADPLARELAQVRLTGVLEGGWAASAEGVSRLSLHASMPSDAELATPWLNKPRGVPLRLQASAALDPAALSLGPMDLDLNIGRGQLQVDRGYVALGRTDGPRPAATLEAGGRFFVDEIEMLRPHLPALAAAGGASGALDGEWMLQLAPAVRRLYVHADLSHLRVAAEPWLVKPAGMPLAGDLNALAEADAAGRWNTGIRLSARMPQAVLSARGEVPHGRIASEGVRCEVEMDVRDPQSLARLSPALSAAAGDASLGGRVSLRAGGLWRPDEIIGEVVFTADRLSYADGVRAKADGVPLRLRVSGRAVRDGELVRLELPVVAADVCESTLRLAARAELAPSWPQAFRNLSAHIRGRFAPDEALLSLAPELRPSLKQWALAGRAELTGELSADSAELRAKLRADATALSAAVPAGLLPTMLTAPLGEAGLRKPAGKAAAVEMEVAAPADLSKVRINNLQVTLDSCGLLAGATLTPEHDWRSLRRAEAHVSLWTTDAGSLAALAPGLDKLRLSGGANLELELVHEGSTTTLPYVNFAARQLSATHAGKQAFLAGELCASNVKLSAGGEVSIGRLRADALQWSVGDNGGWLMIDASDLPAAVRGNLPGGLALSGVVNYLDDRDIAAWLMGPPPRGELSVDQKVAMAAAAEGLIDRLRPLAANADFGVRLWARRLRSYDATVGESLDVRLAELAVAVKDGGVAAAFDGGLGGGAYRARAGLDFAQSSPMVHYETSLSGAQASPSMQRQLSKWFPGNTLYGTLSQSEKRQLRLRDWLANATDSRYPTWGVGESRTVVIDGLLQGRAAPQVIANIFPGLNWASYRYNRMTSFTTFAPDGSAESDMIFSGQAYDTYIEGSTAPDGRAEYQMGLILLSGPQSPDGNHQTHLGRLPVLKIRGRIAGGKMLDEEVLYPRPDETLSKILLSPVYQAWKSARK
jgi:hypothetical protein